MVHLPEEYLFAARVSVLLRGMGKAFGMNLIMSQLWKEEAEKFLNPDYTNNIDMVEFLEEMGF